MPTPALAVANGRVDLACDEFQRPRFRRRDIALALGVGIATFQNWSCRDQISLDADDGRSTGWRLFNARDALRLAVAVTLTRAGLPASCLKATIARIEAAFPFSTRNAHLTTGRPAVVVATFGGAVLGPIFGNALDLDETPDETLIVLRMAEIARQILAPLGFAQVQGNGHDGHASAAASVATPPPSLTERTSHG